MLSVNANCFTNIEEHCGCRLYWHFPTATLLLLPEQPLVRVACRRCDLDAMRCADGSTSARRRDRQYHLVNSETAKLCYFWRLLGPSASMMNCHAASGQMRDSRPPAPPPARSQTTARASRNPWVVRRLALTGTMRVGEHSRSIATMGISLVWRTSAPVAACRTSRIWGGRSSRRGSEGASVEIINI